MTGVHHVPKKTNLVIPGLFRIVEQVMKQYERRADDEYPLIRQSHHQAHYHHTCPDCPDYLEYKNVVKRVKSDKECYNEHLYQDEPEAPFDQENAQCLFVFSQSNQECGYAGQEYKIGRAKMSNPSRKVKPGCRRSQTQRILHERLRVKKIAHMVQRHDHHDNSTQQINGSDPVSESKVG